MELWARKRLKDGVGHPFEFITHLNLEQVYSETDKLDRVEYEECMVVEDGRCVFYREFDLPYTKRRDNDFRRNI